MNIEYEKEPSGVVAHGYNNRLGQNIASRPVREYGKGVNIKQSKIIDC